MAGFQQSFAHFLRTGHFISDNTPVTFQQLNIIKAYKGANPALFDSMPPHQSIRIVATPTNGTISEKDCPHCRKSMEAELKEAEKEVQKKLKVCEENLDKFYQSVEQRLLMFGVRAPSLATAPEIKATENKEEANTLHFT